jgi:hypothetical protein
MSRWRDYRNSQANIILGKWAFNTRQNTYTESLAIVCPHKSASLKGEGIFISYYWSKETT